jgi:hypothetical protein
MADDDVRMGEDFMPYPTNAELGKSLINYQAAPAGDGPTAFRDPGNVPWLTAYAGDPMTVHAVMSPGSENSHVFSLGGLSWPQDPFVDSSNLMTAQGIGPWETFTASVNGGAGGTQQAPGDYFYGDARRPFTQIGLWGLQRVLPTPTACPAPGAGIQCLQPLRTVPGAPVIGAATRGNGSALVQWAAPVSDGGSPVTGYSVRVVDAANVQVGALRTAPAGATSLTVTGLTNGSAVSFQVQAVNTIGAGPFSAPSNTVTPATLPSPPLIGVATRANASALVRWGAPANGGSAITGYSVQVLNAANAQVGALRPAAAGATSLNVTGLVNGTALRFRVQARNAVGTGAYSGLSAAVVPATVPGRPVIKVASPGVAGGVVNATARWLPPVSTGGSPVNGYQVSALRMNSNGTVARVTIAPVQAATTRLRTMTLPAGNYRFTVRARNALGLGVSSARSNLVTAR